MLPGQRFLLVEQIKNTLQQGQNPLFFRRTAQASPVFCSVGQLYQMLPVRQIGKQNGHIDKKKPPHAGTGTDNASVVHFPRVDDHNITLSHRIDFVPDIVQSAAGHTVPDFHKIMKVNPPGFGKIGQRPLTRHNQPLCRSVKSRQRCKKRHQGIVAGFCECLFLHSLCLKMDR